MPAPAANSNPSVTFFGGTNTNPAGAFFQRQLYSISGYANFSGRLLSSVRTATNWTRVYSNDTVAFSVAPFATVGTNTNPTNFPVHGVHFDLVNGRLFGTPTTNFVLSIAASNLQVVSTNIASRITNVLVFSSNATTETTNGPITNSFTNSNTNAAFRFVFYSNPAVVFTQTVLGVNTTNSLPSTNTNTDQANHYYLLNGPGDLRDGSGTNLPRATWHTETSNGPIRLVVSNAGVITLYVGNNRSADGLWREASRAFSVLVTNPAPSGFAFHTNTGSAPFTKTNLAYLESTPLILSNAGVTNTLIFSLNRPEAGRLFRSNGLAYVQALSGSGTLTVEAVRPSTATSSAATSGLAITLSRKTSEIVWGFPFSSNRTTFTNTDPSVTSLFLLATASSGAQVAFSTTNTNASILNQRTLLFSNETDIEVVATPVGENTALWVPATPKTNRVSNPVGTFPLPGFVSTNRRDGVQGQRFDYRLAASHATSYLATNLPPGLVFNGTNLLSGTNTQPGIYRITLKALGKGGTNTHSLYSLVAPSNPPSQTNPWSFAVSLGLDTNTSGIYTFSNLPEGVGQLTNTNGPLSGSVVLTNTNLTNGFAGVVTNITVTFSNADLGVLSTNLALRIAPTQPTLAYSSPMIHTQGIAFSNGPGTITGTNVPGYPVVVRSLGLPPGLEVVASNGLLRGTPTAAGVFLGSLWAENASGSSSTNRVTFDIRPAAKYGQPLQITLAGLFSNRPGTYASTNLPTGLVLSANSGVISGRPFLHGTSSLTVSFTPAGGGPGTNESYQFFIQAADVPAGATNPTLTYPPEVSATQGVVFSLPPSSLTGTNVPAFPLEFLSRSLPPGLAVNPASGVIQGTPSAGGIFFGSVWATNQGGGSATNAIRFTIQPQAVAGRPVLIQLAGLFSNLPGLYSVAPLPSGLFLSARSGSIFGQPRQIGTFTSTVVFTPSGGVPLSSNYVFTFLPPAPRPVLPASSVTAKQNQDFWLQPGVTGVGWEWAGQDSFANLGLSSRWGATQASNASGALRPMTNGSGLTYSNTGTNAQSLSLLWGQPLPGTLPWQAMVRIRVAATNHPTNGLLQPFLGVAPNAGLADTNLKAFLSVQGSNQVPAARDPGATNLLAAIPAGREVGVSIAYSTEDGGRLVVSISTNSSWTNFSRTSFFSSSNLLAGWNLTNRLQSFRLTLGVDASNAPSTNSAVGLRHFTLLPGGVTFSAMGLPPGLAIDPNFGTITGTPTTVGSYSVWISSANGQGTNTVPLSILVAP